MKTIHNIILFLFVMQRKLNRTNLTWLDEVGVLVVSLLQFPILSVENLYRDKLLIFNLEKPKRQNRTSQTAIICLPSHKVFQNTTLSSALTSHHGDLWQIYARWLPNMSECILDFVHNRDKVFHAFIPHFVFEKRTLPLAHFPVPYTKLWNL